MADAKISALSASTTPLAGTEVLPIVQSGVTKKVAISDLTAGRAVSMSTAAVGVSSLASIGSPIAGIVGGTNYDTNFNINTAFLSNTTNQSGVQIGWNPTTKNGIISGGYGDGTAGLEFWNLGKRRQPVIVRTATGLIAAYCATSAAT